MISARVQNGSILEAVGVFVKQGTYEHSRICSLVTMGVLVVVDSFNDG